MTKEPSRRLGSGLEDAKEIKIQSYFDGVDWEGLLSKNVPPPFMPNISNPSDISNFDEEFTKQLPVLTPVKDVLDEIDQREFRGFSYTAEWALMNK